MTFQEIMNCISGHCHHPKCEADTIRGQIHWRKQHPMIGESKDFAVKIECYNKEDADALRSEFTEEELKMIYFTWLVWP